jgi:hypothetical protein
MHGRLGIRYCMVKSSLSLSRVAKKMTDFSTSVSAQVTSAGNIRQIEQKRYLCIMIHNVHTATFFRKKTLKTNSDKVNLICCSTLVRYTVLPHDADCRPATQCLPHASCHESYKNTTLPTSRFTPHVPRFLAPFITVRRRTCTCRCSNLFSSPWNSLPFLQLLKHAAYSLPRPTKHQQ